MSAFLIVYATVTDTERFGAYVSSVMPVIAQYGGRVAGRSAPPVLLEGDWNWQAATVFEFPSVDAAKAFWTSPEYADAKKLRAGAATFQAIVVQGMGASKE